MTYMEVSFHQIGGIFYMSCEKKQFHRDVKIRKFLELIHIASCNSISNLSEFLSLAIIAPNVEIYLGTVWKVFALQKNVVYYLESTQKLNCSYNVLYGGTEFLQSFLFRHIKMEVRRWQGKENRFYVMQNHSPAV